MKVMNKKLTKSNYPVNIFLLLTHISLQLFLFSSSLLFLSVKRGFKFVCNGWFQFSKHTSTFLIFKTRNFGILSDWMNLYFESNSFGSAAYTDIVCLLRDTFAENKNDYLAKKLGGLKPPSPHSGAAPVIVYSLEIWENTHNSVFPKML